MTGRSYYTIDDVKRNQFYQLQKFLFEGEFKSMSSDAKILYALIRDRHELSIENEWVDKNGRVFLIMTREEMCDMLGCSQPTIRKSIDALIRLGLMEEVRQGQNKPNLIYLLNVQFRNAKNFHSGMKETYTPECKNLSPNNTNNNKTDIFKKESKPKPQIKPDKQEQPEGARKSYDSVIADYTQNAELGELIIEYIKSRKNAKRPLTNKTLELLLARLDELARDDLDKIKIINEALRNGWYDFYPLRAEPPRPAESSFDTDEFFNNAVKKAYASMSREVSTNANA